MINLSGTMRAFFHGERSLLGYFADEALFGDCLLGGAMAPLRDFLRTEFGHVSASASSAEVANSIALNADAAVNAIQIGTDFVVSGNRWTQTVITWSFATANYSNQQGINFTNSFPVGGNERSLITQAINIWDAASPNLTFQYVADASDVDIRFGWGENLASTGSDNTLAETWTFTSGTNTLYAGNDIYNTMSQALIRIDRADTYSDLGGYSTDKPFLNVALHEIGHALGLAHYDLNPAIMNTYATNMTSLTSHETNGIAYLYPGNGGGGGSGADYTASITSISSTSGAAGDTITVNYRISNISQQTGTGPSWKLYISQDQSISSTNEVVDINVGTGYVLTSMNGGASVTGTTTFTVPSNITGTWYLGLVADPGNYISESNESNNVSNLYSFNVASVTRPDLVVDTLSVSNNTVAAGGTTTVSYHLFNPGNATAAPSTSRIYLSTDPTITTSDTVLRTVVFSNSVSPNNFITDTQTVTVPSNLGPGTYYIGVIADFDSQITESNENNNASTAVAITISAPNHAPVVTAPQPNVTATAGQTINVSSLFSASDSDGDTLTYYLYDSNTGANSGRFMVNGTAVPAQTITQLTAAQFAQATFVAGAAGNTDDIRVQAFDGKAYSGWNTNVLVSVPSINHAPVVTAPQVNVTATAGQTINVSSLFSASDSDGDTLTYYLYDSNTGANSGRFMVNGTAVPAQTITQLTAAQFAQATFVAGAAGNTDDIRVQAFDGKAYSGWNTKVLVSVPSINHAPVVTAPQPNVTATAGQTINVSSLFSASDSDGDTLTYYLYDSNAGANSGRFIVNGTAVPAQTITQLTAAQFAQATFVAGAAGNSDDIRVQVYDGKAYSGWNTGVIVTVPMPADDYRDSFTDTSSPFGQVAVNGVRSGSLEAAGDRDWFAVQLTANVTYTFNLQGTTGGGGTLTDPYLRFYGSNGAPIASNDDINSSTNRDSLLTYRPTTSGTYYIEAGAYNDNITGTYRVAVAALPNHAPTVTVPQANVTATAGQTINVSSLFSASDSDGDTLTYYLYDSNTGANSGRFMVNGTAVPAQTITPLTAAQFAQATFVAGAVGNTDDIRVQVYDGQAYSGWNASVKVAVPAVNHAPVVSLPAGADFTATASQSIAVSSLFRASDSDGDALTYYFYDSNTAANSGHFVVNGTIVPAQTIYQVTAAQFVQATFVAGAAGVTDDIRVQAFDGKAYSGWNAGVDVTVPAANQAPTVITPSGTSVSTSAGQPVQLSALFSGSDLDGDALTYYVYDSSSTANSGHFVVGGNVVAARTITPMTAAQLAQATFVAGASGTVDDIYVQAFDGKAYSGWNTVVHIGTSTGNHAPMVGLPAGASLDTNAGQSIALSNLFRGSDVDGNALSYYLYDANGAANSGHFVVGGNAVPAQTITAVTAAQLAQATFVAGAAGTADDIFVQAFDGQLYSGWNAGVHVLV